MRILHAPNNIAGLAGTLARAECELGVRAHSYQLHRSAYNYSADIEIRANGSRTLQALYYAIRLAVSYDVFTFYFGESLMGPYLWDVPWLKRMGKKIFFYFHGCELRNSKKVIASAKHSACTECWPQLCSPNRKRALEAARKYANGVFVSTPDLLEFYEGSVWLPQPVKAEDLNKLSRLGSQVKPSDGLFTIVHAPSNRTIKGTRHVEAAVAALKDKGYPVVLRIIENMTHDQAMSCCAHADVAVDQMLIGAYGVFAIEMMMLGKPVVCYIRDDLKSVYGPTLPIINADPEQLETVLADLYQRRQELPEKGASGVGYVRQFHEASEIAHRTVKFYQDAYSL